MYVGIKITKQSINNNVNWFTKWCKTPFLVLFNRVVLNVTVDCQQQ